MATSWSLAWKDRAVFLKLSPTQGRREGVAGIRGLLAEVAREGACLRRPQLQVWVSHVGMHQGL